MIQSFINMADPLYHNPRDVDVEQTHGHVVVIGGGTMGGGIATSLLAIDVPVTLVDASEEVRQAASSRIEDSLTRMAKCNDDLNVANALEKLSVTSDPPEGPVDLVIEAVPERLELKRSVFGVLANTYGDSVVFASNTSSLSITSIADSMPAPQRFVGMHFFNPVPVSALVEVVVGAETDDVTTNTATRWAERLGKTPIVVNDSPGFASSRLGIALGMEAIRMLEEGVASASDIDKAMELGYRHPMGPLRLTDLIGLDVRLAIAEHLFTELGVRFEPPALLREMVADGKLGKKTGTGFYNW